MKSLAGISLALSMSLALGGCANSAQNGQLDGPPGNQAQAKNLQPTIRQAAVDAEASYNYKEAADHYAALLAKSPDDLDLTLALARNLRFAGAPQQAIGLLNQTMGKQGRKTPLLLELGKAYLASDQLNLAVSTLIEARIADTANWNIASTLGIAYDYQERHKEAQAAYNDALTIFPNNPVVLNNLALSLAQSGALDEAIATMQRAVDLPTAKAQQRQNLALLLALKGDADSAERLARSDLPPDMAENNAAYFHSLLEQ